MTEFLELALELVGGAAECFCAWRFYLCLMCSLALTGGICWLVSDGTLVQPPLDLGHTFMLPTPYG